MSKFLVRLKPNQGKYKDHKGQIHDSGDEFELQLKGVSTPSGSFEVLEVLDPGEKVVPTPSVHQIKTKPLRGEEQILDSDPNPTPTSEQTIAAQAATIQKTAEGSEIVDSFPMGSNPNPALLKAKIAEVEKAEATGTLKVEEGEAGAPAGERFQIVKKSGVWQNIVDTESGAVLNEKGMKMADALDFKAKLIEASNPPKAPAE